jgi:hypothetical protein
MRTGTDEIRAARRKRIERFAARQEKCRKFVRLADLTEYRARKDDETFGVNKDRLHNAYIDFAVSILKGGFELTGKSHILCMSEDLPPMRLRADFLAARRINLGDQVIIEAYLSHCWAPIDAMLRWCEDKKINPPPAWLRERVEPAARQPDPRVTVFRYGYRLDEEYPRPFALELADDYIEHARRGLITPAEIEAELKAKGLEPLAVKPDPKKFDPMAEIWWTLPMAAAWIVWRTPHAVRRAWSNYRREVREWLGPYPLQVLAEKQPKFGYRHTETVNGYTLERCRDVDIFEVLHLSTLNFGTDGVAVLVGNEARLALWHKLQSGQLIAEGIRNSGGERTPIRDAEWIDLDHYHQRGWPADAIGAQMEKWPRYLAVRVRSAKVVELWRTPEASEAIAEPARPSKPPGRRYAVRQAFRELWPDGVTPGLMIQQRDAKIMEWFKDKGLSPPSSRTIARALEGMSEGRA